MTPAWPRFMLLSELTAHIFEIEKARHVAGLFNLLRKITQSIRVVLVA